MVYSNRTNLIIGFHGCDKATRDKLISNPQKVRMSEKPYEWLGHGFYIWENNYDRALQWAQTKAAQGQISEPSVVGVMLNLGHCCDLSDAKCIELLRSYFLSLEAECAECGKALPQNKDIPHDVNHDRLLRLLDCAVIEHMHARNFDNYSEDIAEKGFSDAHIFDTVRATFHEGAPIYEGSAFYEKTHTQICVRNLNNIKCFFMPREDAGFYSWGHGKYSSIADQN